MEHVTTSVAGAALVAPWWMPDVHTGMLLADLLHTFAIWLTPFAGLTYLILKIYYMKKDKSD
jgi:hypothetical protein